MSDLMDIQTKRKKGRKKVNIMKTISAIGSPKTYPNICVM
jgi:hypothetical protein